MFPATRSLTWWRRTTRPKNCGHGSKTMAWRTRQACNYWTLPGSPRVWQQGGPSLSSPDIVFRWEYLEHFHHISKLLITVPVPTTRWQCGPKAKLRTMSAVFSWFCTGMWQVQRVESTVQQEIVAMIYLLGHPTLPGTGSRVPCDLIHDKWLNDGWIYLLSYWGDPFVSFGSIQWRRLKIIQ